MRNRCEVYWNTHRKCFSIKPVRGTPPPIGFKSSPSGRVLYSTGPFLLERPFFRVSEAGRQWVIKHQRKTVHATIRGHIKLPAKLELPKHARRVRYNPYRHDSFMTDRGAIEEANVAYFINNEVWVT
ncbi:hypothetical protein [Nitratireductor aquimarinus]